MVSDVEGPGVQVPEDEDGPYVSLELPVGRVEDPLVSGEADVKVVPEVLGVQVQVSEVEGTKVDVSGSDEENVVSGVDQVGQADVVGYPVELPVG